jgi:predicted nucleotidyltransferase
MNPVLPKQLDEMVQRLVDSLKPEQIILFSSYAYGKPNADSNVDLLVIVAESDELGYRRAQKAYGALSGIGVSKDIIVMTRAEVEWKAEVPNSSVNQAIQQGIVLYG